MAPLLRVAGIAALVSVAAAEEHSSLRAAHGHRRKHHHRLHPAEQHQQQEQLQSESEQFAHIQKDLIEAWKERTHLEQLQHTIDTQKALLGQQKKLVSQNSEAVSDEERSQFQMVVHMVRSSKSMMTKIRQAAIKKVKDAMSSVMNIDEAAGKDIEENKRRIEAAKAEIDRANAATAKDQQIKQRSQKVLAAAVQEATYFQSMLSAKNRKASSVTESAQKEEVSQETSNKEQVVTEKTQQNEVSKEKVEASKEDVAGAEKEDSTEADKEELEEVDEDKAQKEEASQEKARKEEASYDDVHIKKESLIAVYQQVMHDE